MTVGEGLAFVTSFDWSFERLFSGISNISEMLCHRLGYIYPDSVCTG